MNFLTHLNTRNPADCLGDLANESLAPRWDKVGGCHWYCRHEGSAWQDRLRGCEVSWLTLYFAPWLDQMKQGFMMCVRFTHPCLMWWGILWYYEQIQNYRLTVLNECRVWLRSELLYAECIFLFLLVNALSSLQAKMDVVHVPQATFTKKVGCKQSLSSLRESILHLWIFLENPSPHLAHFGTVSSLSCSLAQPALSLVLLVLLTTCRHF